MQYTYPHVRTKICPCAIAGDALHLSARQLVREAIFKSIESYRAQAIECGFSRATAACKQKREFDIFGCGKRMKQLERLENETDFVAAQSR